MFKYKESSDALKEALKLERTPIAVKLTNVESDIPTDAFRPYRDKRQHWALCQIMTMVKERHMTVAMSKEDHWCWKPLIGLGLVDCEPGSKAYEISLKNNGCNGCANPTTASAANFDELPKLPRDDKNIIIVAPLDICTFEPDVILVYCNTNRQLSWMIGAQKFRSGKRVDCSFDYIDSCIWSILPTYLDRKLNVTIPDPGEVHRGCCPENEIIFSVPTEMWERIVKDTCMKVSDQNRRLKNPDGSDKMKAAMEPDFPRPEFYNKLFELWGLDCDGTVAWSEKDRV